MYDALCAADATFCHVSFLFISKESLEHGISPWTVADMNNLILNFVGFSQGPNAVAPVAVGVSPRETILNDYGPCVVCDLNWVEDEDANGVECWSLVAEISMPAAVVDIIYDGGLESWGYTLVGKPPSHLQVMARDYPYSREGAFLERVELHLAPTAQNELALKFAKLPIKKPHPGV